MTAPFVVVGGGITGLAAAWELTAVGHQVLLVEASDRFGGKVFSETVDGFLLEHGADSFVSYRPGAVQMVADLGLADDIVSTVPPRLVYLRVRGRMEPIPAGMGMVLPTRLWPFARTRILTWPQKLRAAVDLVLPRLLGPQDMSIGALLRRRLGSGVVARFADPLVGGIYGATVDELSVDTVLPMLRTYEAERRSLILASLAQGRSVPRSASPESPFRSMRTGMGSLVDAMVAGLRARGADLRTGLSVEGLEVTATGAVVHLSDGTRHEARGVIMAGGAASSSDLLAEVAPGAAEALRAVPHNSTATVHLGFVADAFDAPPAGHGYLEAGPEPAPITGVTIASGKWSGRAPAGMVLIMAILPDR
ncbi:MAG: protoporphyrinogen oxidase, partial [Demequina sp.]